MSTAPLPSPTEIAALRDLLQEAQGRIERLHHALKHKQQTLTQQLQTVHQRLKTAGLETPEDIARAYAELDATERQALEREHDVPAESAAPSHPSQIAKRSRFGRTV